MDSDLTFITNEDKKNLLERFKVLIKDTQFFDVLVGYFYISGFHELYKSLEKTEKIRILIGINTNKKTYELIEEARDQQAMQFSHYEVKQSLPDEIVSELEESEDDARVDEGVEKFIEWIREDKLEVRAYPSEQLHSKLYIMSFQEGDRDKGRVITGSSNFTRSGLADNLEFNVELKTRADYEFAKKEFNKLWESSVDVSEKYVQTIESKTWVNNNISPYELYLKFLYEYFKEEINRSEEVQYKYTPQSFKKLQYQEQAILSAKNILDQYGGVFLSDVVGLGKTYEAALLAHQLDGLNLVIAPPALLDENNPGSWKNVFEEFKIAAHFESVGRIEQLARKGTDKYKNVFIDEAHRFRTESNVTYEKLAQITRGKRVILVTATPLNNTPKDILSQIKLFQKPKKSTIPGTPDLEAFFAKLQKRTKNLDRRLHREKYMKAVQENAKEIREKVLKHLMVRRTRNEVTKYFGEDLKKQGLKFPDVAKPESLYYELNEKENEVFETTIDYITQQFKYARYMPMSYYEGEMDEEDQLEQQNVGRFMKILLVKRLESSFYAFRKSIDRFMQSYQYFIEEFERGNVYVSKDYINKIFEHIDDDDEASIQKLLEEDKARKYDAKDFRKDFKQHLEHDLELLKEIKELWSEVERDPKFLKFSAELKADENLKNNKLIIFTESKETADYLYKNLDQEYSGKVIAFTGASSAVLREEVIDNFDAKVKPELQKDKYRILITTEVLAEGVNLHRSNVVVNYDLPWNPTRLMQRVGRINRVDTKFNTVYTYNFFPTIQANEQIKLKEAAEAKIGMFIEMLGNDARLLTDGEEIKSHDLFIKLTSKEVLTGEDEEEDSELAYLQIIRDIRDNDPDLFQRIKQLPKKARSARKYNQDTNATITYFRKGKLQKFYLTNKKESMELDFFDAVKMFGAKESTKKEQLNKDEFYKYLDQNKKEFKFATTEEAEPISKRGTDNATKILKILKAREISKAKEYTEDDEDYVRKVIKLLSEGALPKQTTKVVYNELKDVLDNDGVKPLKVLAVLKNNIASEFFKDMIAESAAQTEGPREVILSEYLLGK